MLVLAESVFIPFVTFFVPSYFFPFALPFWFLLGTLLKVYGGGGVGMDTADRPGRNAPNPLVIEFGT